MLWNIFRRLLIPLKGISTISILVALLVTIHEPPGSSGFYGLGLPLRVLQDSQWTIACQYWEEAGGQWLLYGGELRGGGTGREPTRNLFVSRRWRQTRYPGRFPRQRPNLKSQGLFGL